MVTIKQIAERAGVSTATVSNVIHGKTKKVSPETVEKIQKLIDEMGYVQRMGLRVLHNDSSQLVAVVINCYQGFENSVLSDPFYAITVGIIEEELRRRGYYMMFYSAPDIDDIFKMVMTWDVDGVIGVSMTRANCEKIYNMIHKPTVSIDAHGRGSDQYAIPNVGLQDERGGYLMTQYLFELGYEVVFMCGFGDFGIDRQRWLGAQKVMGDLDFLSRTRKLQFIPLGRHQIEREEYYRQVVRQLPFKKRTALFFTADALAMEANSFLVEKGVRIPEDVGIAGFDDTAVAAKFSSPRLTTVHQDMRQKAALAVEELVASLKDPNYKPQDHKLPVSLVVRKSV